MGIEEDQKQKFFTPTLADCQIFKIRQGCLSTLSFRLALLDIQRSISLSSLTQACRHYWTISPISCRTENVIPTQHEYLTNGLLCAVGFFDNESQHDLKLSDRATQQATDFLENKSTGILLNN